MTIFIDITQGQPPLAQPLSPAPSSVVQLSAREAVESVHNVLAGLPVYIAGSSVITALTATIRDDAFDDVDVFCSSANALISATEKLLAQGFKLNDRFERVWHRWLKYGFKTWHTNSIKLGLPGTNLKVNMVFKLVDGHPTTSLAQVLESFDFGLLAQGLDCESGDWRDMRPFLFPLDQTGDPLPLMPNKRDNWRQGFISQYNGLREVGRYAKYAGYGFDMTRVKDDLVTGYWQAAEYMRNRTDSPEKVQLGIIYESIAMHMEADDFQKLREAGAEILYLDDLDRIMEALE